MSLVALLGVALILLTPEAYAVTAGPNNPSTAANQLECDGGWITACWLNPTNVVSSNNVYATNNDAGTPPNNIVASGFGFNIPTGATIDGITVQVEKNKQNSGLDCLDSSVRLGKNTVSVTGDNKAIAGQWPESDTYSTYGGSNDKWGTTWTAAQINSSGFSVWVQPTYQTQGWIFGSCRIDHIRVSVDYTAPNTAPSITVNPTASYGSYTRTGLQNSPWQVNFTATDAEQTGSNQLQYYIHTGANRTGTLVASGSFTSGSTSKSIAYNASGINSNGSTTLYLSVRDGTVYASQNPSFTVLRDDGDPGSPSGISTNPSPVGTNKQYTVRFTPSDALSTNSNELRYQIRTSAGGGTLLDSGTATSGQQKTSNTITDNALVNGSNTRWIHISDGANNTNYLITQFTVTASLEAVPTLNSTPTEANITASGATLGGNVTSDGNATVDVRGVCYSVTSTNSNPQHGGSGVTCTNASAGGTGVFTVPISGLSAETGYSYKAFAHNSVGYAYSNADTFTTLTTRPTGVGTNAASSVNSYYATLNGAGNPNGYQTAGHFRVFTANPGNCNSDSGGVRYPALSSNDVSLGSGTNSQNYSYTIPFNSSSFLVPNTQYWYCSYAINANGTTGASSVQTFTTSDGPASPCDPPATGDLTVPGGSACTFEGTYNGVDTGSGTTNTGSLTVESGASVTVNAGQRIGRGIASFKSGADLSLAHGSSIVRGGVYVPDADGDGVIDSKAQYVGSTPPEGYVRRNTVSSNYNYAWKIFANSTVVDCDSNSANAYRTTPVAVVVDADNDGYKTSAAQSTTACVGDSSTINGRTYYSNSSGSYPWLTSSQVLGSGATDCTDSSGAPCAPNLSSVGSATKTSLTANWSATTGPAATSYNLFYCDRTSNGACTPSTQIGGSISSGASSYAHNSGITCGRTYAYVLRAVNAAGSSGDSTVRTASTSTCASAPTVITETNPDNSTTTAGGMQSTVNANGADTTITYRWGTSNASCTNLPNTVSGGTVLAEAGATSPNSAVTTSTLTAGQTYYYCVTASNSEGSATGSVVNRRTLPSAPTFSSATAVAGTPYIDLNWTAVSGASGYYIYWCTGSSCTPTNKTGPVSVDARFTGTACGTLYRFRISAYTTGGEGAQSSSTRQATTESGTLAASCYRDEDQDGYTVGAASAACTTTGACVTTQGWRSSASGTADCYDKNATARPNQTSYFTTARGSTVDFVGNQPNSYDYNCQNGEEKQYTASEACTIRTYQYVSSGSLCGCGYDSFVQRCTGPLSQGACGETYYYTSSPGSPTSMYAENPNGGSGSCAPSCTAPYQFSNYQFFGSQKTQGCR